MRHATLAVLLLGLLPAAPSQGATIVNTLLLSSDSQDPKALAGQWVAQRLIPQFAGTLDSVALRMGRVPSAGYPPQVDPVVELWADSGNHPGALVGALTFPAGTSMPESSLMSVTFDGNDLFLNANTAYWIVLKSSVSEYAWRSLSRTVVAGCNASTCGPAFASTNMVTVDGGLNWQESGWTAGGVFHPMTAKMQVDVTPVPEPATAWLLAPLGGLAFFLRRRR